LKLKIARGAAIALALLALLYEVVANVALSSHAIASIVSKHPDRLRLTYARARTFWPGRVHIEGFDLRGRETNLEWQLHIDTADVDISLFALLRHHFRATKAVTTGVTLRLRFRLDANAINADRLARMPPIEGFEAVPILGEPPDTRDPNAKAWTVDIQGVDAQEVREVWIDAYRETGILQAKGGFTVGTGHLTLAPATAEIQTAALTTGDDAIATDIAGKLDAQIGTVDLNDVKGAKILRYVTMHSALKGKMGGVRFIRHFLPQDSVALSGGAGKFENEVNVVQGVVTAKTTSRIDLEPAAFVVSGYKVEGRIRIDLTTGDADEAHKAAWSRVDVGLSDLAFPSPGGAGPAATCKALSTIAQANQIDLAEPEGLADGFGYSWDTARLDVLDMHALDATLPSDSPFHFDRGTASMKTHGAGSLQGASAEADIDSRLTMHVWGARASSGVKGTVPLKASFSARTLDLSGTDLTLSDPALAEWWGKVQLRDSRVHFTPPSVSLLVSTTARDGRPFLTFYEATKGTSAMARIGLDLIPDPMIESMTANLHGAFRLAASEGALDLDRLDVQGKSSRFRGVLKKRRERLDGGLLIEAGPTAFGISFEAGKTIPVVLGARTWFETKVAPATL
jgi:hypothetical protein